MKNKFFILALSLTVLFSCKKLYNPPAIASSNSYLVVEGNIGLAGDSTIIKLSKTVNLNSSVSSAPVTGATVVVADNSGNLLPLMEMGLGYYKALLTLNNQKKYQLKIATSDNKLYSSDLVSAKNSPAIDSLNYKVQANGVQIYLNAHDATNNSRYYRWSYTETYIIHSKYQSYFIHKSLPKDTVVFRSIAEQNYQCWITDLSSTIILGSSAKLVSDVIVSQPITFITSDSEKLGDLYSILVQQYALTADQFNYYQQLKKNTEQLGSIFDAQPSEIQGNVHCTTNPAEPVIGFIGAGTTSTKRIFVDNRNLPAWHASTPYDACLLDTFLYKKSIPGTKLIENQVADFIYPDIFLPVQAIQPINSPIVGFSASSPNCVDCTLRGTNIKPSFWP